MARVKMNGGGDIGRSGEVGGYVEGEGDAAGKCQQDVDRRKSSSLVVQPKAVSAP